MLAQIMPPEGTVFSFKEGSSKMDHCALEELSCSLQLCEPFSVSNVDPSRSSIVKENSSSEILVGAFNSITMVETPELRDDKGNYEVDDTDEAKLSDRVCVSSPRRSARVTKLNQKNSKIKAARKASKKVFTSAMLDSIFLRVARKKRTHNRRAACSSVWGSVGISQFIENRASVVSKKGSRKSKKRADVQGSRMEKKNKTVRGLQISNEKTGSSSGRIRIKVKLRKEMNQTSLADMGSVMEDGLQNDGAIGKEIHKLTNFHISNREVHGDVGAKCCNRDLEKVVMLSEPIDSCLASKDLQNSVKCEKSDEFIADNHHPVSSLVDIEGSGALVDKKYLDLGTSPDSEVINLVPETQVYEKEQEDFHDVQISSPKFAVPSDIRSVNLPQGKGKKGNQVDNMPDGSDSNVPDELGSPEIINQASVVVKCGQGERLDDGFEFSEASISTVAANLSSNTSSSDRFSKKLLSSPRAGDLEGVFPRAKNRGRKNLKNSRSRQVSESGPKNFDVSRSQKGNACIQKGSSAKSVGRMKVKDDATCNELQRVENFQIAGHDSLDDFGKNKSGDGNMVQEVFNLDSADGNVGNQCLPLKDAWVCCDECFKWRRIPHTLAGPVTNCRWTCKENFDKDFADCSIPQEKSNSEINTELGISDASGEEDADCGRNPLAVPQKTSWRRIKSNVFMHRNRKSQSIDEIMVCHCKPPTNGKLGCGNGCLNRMLNIECVRGACPCGESCSNQQFQKRQYAKLKKVWCGKKGYGLQLLEDISEGKFLIEYVGEVLDMQAYEARQRDYASKGHRHFYFMTLNGSEVIDACGKGNLGRFINHSCDPNCRTEKWIVNGEVCIGLFALKDLKKGEEVTFDYNYVRVFGAAAKKCACGSSQCRGYIGGDPQNSEVIVRGDSDDEFPESVMVYDDGESDVNLKNLTSATSPSDGTKESIANVDPKMTNEDVLERTEIVVDRLEGATELQIADVLAKDGDRTDESANGFDDLEIIPGNSCSKSTLSERLQTGEVEKSVEMLQPSVEKVKTSSQLDNVSVDTISDSQQAILSSPEASGLTVAGKKSLSNANYTKKKLKSDRNEDSRAPKSSAVIRTCLSYSVKRGKVNSNKSSNYGNVKTPETMVNKSHGLLNKPKKTIEGSRNGHFDAVEEKLNELLDIDGGISKRKDAAKGYLKLLLLTAASGDGGSGEAIQSNRDLSMILGAILKTKSRSVLVDIISKNGLQMLHNIMKRYRRDFSKIPILRKLLKVLEFLAATEIITLELINRDPPCPGVESFRESILTLTEHDDKQVHQIARNFRDKWIPWSLRKSTDFHRGSNCNRFPASHVSWWEKNPQSKDAVNGNNQLGTAGATVSVDAVMNEGCSSSSNGMCPTSGTLTRKRRSRWDDPGDAIKAPKIQPIFLQIPSSSSQPESGQHLETRADDGSEDMNEDLPPGFAPRNAPSFNQGNGSPFRVELGHPQGKFMNRTAVSYGIPLPVVQQLGCPKAQGLEEWVIAPGVPFHPFPPLPPYSCDRSNNLKVHQGNHHPSTCHSDHNPSSNSGSFTPDVKIQCTNIRQGFQATRDSHRLGRKYFRQQKWSNNSRSPEPWIKKQKLFGSLKERI